MKYNTIEEATRQWVREFNAFPLEMIIKLFYAEPDDWTEITPISTGDRVWSNENQDCGKVVNIHNDIATVELDCKDTVECEIEDLSREYDDYFPMWGTMWQFNDSADDYWLENHLREMADCGFRIYESENFGYFFGIDGAGYDFYEAHWIPLYKARGLRWHKEDDK